MFVQYDSIGVGSGVKAETNRLNDDGLMPKGVEFVSWSAGAGVLDPESRVIDGDSESPLNKDFYTNLKAQAWWELRRRFERTHRAVTEGVHYDQDELISISSDLPLLRTVQKELSQTASNALFDFVDRRPVECIEVDCDRYRRAVSVCTFGGSDIADWLVRNGLALDWPRYSKGGYADAQTEAKREQRGMWGGSFREPWNYRACRRSGGRPEGCSD